MAQVGSRPASWEPQSGSACSAPSQSWAELLRFPSCTLPCACLCSVCVSCQEPQLRFLLCFGAPSLLPRTILQPQEDSDFPGRSGCGSCMLSPRVPIGGLLQGSLGKSAFTLCPDVCIRQAPTAFSQPQMPLESWSAGSTLSCLPMLG